MPHVCEVKRIRVGGSRPNPAMKGAGSGMIVDEGKQFRLYTTHPDVRVYFPRAR